MFFTKGGWRKLTAFSFGNTSITAPDSAQITYAYTGDLLSAVNYPNGKSVQITYSNQKPKTVTLYDNGAPVYKFAYTFKGYSVSELIEYGYENGVAEEGIRKTYTYSQSQGRTVVSTNENLRKGTQGTVLCVDLMTLPKLCAVPAGTQGTVLCVKFTSENCFFTKGGWRKLTAFLYNENHAIVAWFKRG